MPTNTLDAQLDAISSVTHKHIFPKLVDNINTSNILISKVTKEKTSGGVDLRQPLRYARGVQQNYSGSETLNVSYVEKVFSAIWQWKQKNVPIVISGLDRLKNGNGPEKVLDFVKIQMQMAEEDIMDMFGTGLYSAGTDAKEIDGLRLALSTSNTYGGISQSANSWWQSVVDATTTTFSLSALQTNYQAAKQGPDAVDLILFDETQFNKYWGSLQPQQRFSDAETAKAGFKNLMFNGAVCSEESYIPTGYIIGINTKHVTLVSSTQRNFPGEFIKFDSPVNQDVDVAHIRWAGNLKVTQPRKCFAMTALT